MLRRHIFLYLKYILRIPANNTSNKIEILGADDDERAQSCQKTNYNKYTPKDGINISPKCFI